MNRFVLLRHLVAIVILPVSVTALVPQWIAERYHVVLRAGTGAPAIVLQMAGAASVLLGVVLFASSFFFAGMSVKLKSPNLRIAMLSIGCVLFLATAVWIATSPVSVTV